jgi:AraC family transcriptional regulator, transcriptional activator of pobA
VRRRAARSPAVIGLQRDAPPANAFEQSFRMLAREFDRSARGRGLALEGWLKVILAGVLRASQAATGAPAETVMSRHRALVARFRELIEEEFRDNRSVAGYASALNVSESRLRHACLGVTEQSPIQIIHARVLLEAKRQLLYTGRPVSEIAYALGFQDPAYFTRFFSRRTGMSPSGFRARGPRG